MIFPQEGKMEHRKSMVAIVANGKTLGYITRITTPKASGSNRAQSQPRRASSEMSPTPEAAETIHKVADKAHVAEATSRKAQGPQREWHAPRQVDLGWGRMIEHSCNGRGSANFSVKVASGRMTEAGTLPLRGQLASQTTAIEGGKRSGRAGRGRSMQPQQLPSAAIFAN